MALADDKVVANALKRNEVEPQDARHSLGGDAAVALSGLNAAGSGQMAICDAIVSPHVAAADSQPVELFVQQEPAAGTDVAIDNANARTCGIGNAANLAGIPMGHDKALLPQREGEHGYVLAAKEAEDGRQIRLPGFLVADVTTGDVNHTVAEQLQCAQAIAVFDNEINSLALQMSREDGDSRIAPRDKQASFEGARLLEELDHCPAGLFCSPGRIGGDAIGMRQAPSTQFRRDRDQSIINAAQL